MIKRTILILAALTLAASASPVAIGTLKPVVPAKMIALSFDDVPRGAGAFLTIDQRNVRLIAQLRAARVDQVAFFVNPGRIHDGDGHAERIARYVAAGHVIANHTFMHPRLSVTPAAAYVEDIAKAEGWLKGRPGYRPWFRFPALDEGGPDKAKRDVVRAGLKSLGLTNGYVTVDGSDWYLDGLSNAAKKAGKPVDMAALRRLYIETMVQSADFSDDLMFRTLGRRPPQMLLLHETDLAALFVGDLVKALRADGWTIVTADRAYADSVYATAPDVPWTNGTLAEQLAWEKQLPPPRWYDRNDTKVANALFVERVLHGPAAPVPVPQPDPTALARAAQLPHIPVALRGCWRSDDPDHPDNDEQLQIDYASIRQTAKWVAGTRIALAESVSRVAPKRIDGVFSAPTKKTRETIATMLSLGPDDLGTPAGKLRMSEGDAGSRWFSRCGRTITAIQKRAA